MKTASQLKRQQVQDSRDLVRYETGVTVVEAGRFGSSGYSIRGVDDAEWQLQ
ncbi:TonB-dependent receptor plug domain-containing protein [Pasteurella multocida]|nr:TonB-dependent receptor plug domain-containing protein [Pasteurella multocida]WEO86243.1 TonB-dependent receptor plug domain-containing protein [Pasteurella multocida]